MSGVVLALLVFTLGVAACDWVALARRDVHLDRVCRPLVTLLLIAVTVELQPRSVDAWAWFLIALCCSLLGELAMMASPNLFTTSLGLFVGAHIAYFAGMLFLGIQPARLVVGLVLSGIGVLALGRMVVRNVQAESPDLVEPVKAYIGAMSAMAVGAFAVGRPVGVLGAGLFYAADAMGSWNRFVQARPLLPLATTVAYQLGQLGLILSLL
jgi:uncharacterized membrane protein YhhN